MTQEEKAKAYDEALERARKLYNDAKANEYKSDMEDYEFIFPQLAESEDERIRRALVEYFNPEVQLDFVRGVPIQKIRDWLEKQKEPDYLNKFTKLPHLNSDYEVVDDWAYTPSLGHCDGNWAVCWIHCEDGDVLHECIGDTPAEAIDKAVEWFTSLNKQIPVKEVGAIISSRDKEETACGYLERCLTPDMRKVWYEACDELKKACFQEAEKQKEQKSEEVDESTKRLNDNWMKQHFDDYKGWSKVTINGEPIPTENRSVDIPLVEWSEKHIADIFEKVGLAKIVREQGNDELTNAVQSAMIELSKVGDTEWSEEDEKLFWGFTAWVPNEELERLGVTRDDILKKLKSIRLQPIQLKEAYKDGFQTARQATVSTFMTYLDENRPEGKMGLSNSECEDIDKAFKENDWAKIMRYVEKYRPHWKPSEEQMKALLNAEGFLRAGLQHDSAKTIAGLYEQLKKLM